MPDELLGQPVHGTDATGADTYVEIIAAPTGHRRYRHLVAHCLTQPAIISIDGGTTEHLYVPAGVNVAMNDVDIRGAVHAKNAVGGSNYIKIHVSVW